MCSLVVRLPVFDNNEGRVRTEDRGSCGLSLGLTLLMPQTLLSGRVTPPMMAA